LLQTEYRGLSVCLSVTIVSPAKTAELTDRDAVWDVDSGICPENYKYVLVDGGPDLN